MGETRLLAIDPDGRLEPVVDTLSAAGMETTVTEDVPGALDHAEDRRPDALLVLDAPATDAHDDVDGPTQVRELHSLLDGVPVVGYVRREGHRPLVALLEAGAEDVCRVPPEREDLLARKVRYAAGTGGEFDDEATQLESLFDAYPQDLFLKDDRNRFVQHTGHADHLEPFEREWITNLTEYELFPREFADFLYEEEQTVLETGEAISEKVEYYRTPAGEDRWVSTTKVPRYDDEGRLLGVVGASLDVTDVKRQERLMAALHDASRELTRAETRTEIARVAGTIPEDIGPLPAVEVALFDRDGSGLAPVVETGRTRFETYSEWYYRAAAEDVTLLVVPEGVETTPDASRVVTDRVGADIDPALFVPLGDHGVVGFLTDGDHVDGYTAELAQVLAANVEAALDRAERERRLTETNDRLREFALLGSHELRNRLQRALGQVSRLRAYTDAEELDGLEATISGLDALVGQLVTLARTGEVAAATRPVSLPSLAQRAWERRPTDEATLAVETDLTVEADPDSLSELLGHLFDNAVEHVGPTVTVRIGRCQGGFYVADDGPGIPETTAETLFDFDDDAPERSGYGLYVVSMIADAHGWSVSVADADAGGARIEVTGVTAVE